MKRAYLAIVLALFALSALASTASSSNPRLAILISKASYKQSWETTQMAGHAWVGIANLAGIPYDTLFVEEIPSATELSRYSALVFAQAAAVNDATYDRLVSTLTGYLGGHGNILLDGPLATNDENGNERSHGALDQVLGVGYGGSQGGVQYRVRVGSSRHQITRVFQRDQFLSPVLASAANVLKAQSGGTVLLNLTDGRQSFPYLSCAQGKGRMVFISDFGTAAGAGTFFRNDAPQLAYDNQLWNALIRALQWAAYGDLDLPFPAPQVTNANMTAVVRLDGDNSSNLDFQVQTLNFLAGVARETGVVPLYTWVSSQVEEAGWDKLAPLGKKLEDLGGEIGTHSKFHDIDRSMTDQRWRDELDGSIEEIESNMQAQGYPIPKIRSMINPGDTIPMEDYGQLASRFSFYMTHGFEQTTPIGFGNMTWFTGANKNFVVLENSPHPDYQWFYDPTWSYTTAQITSDEEAVIDRLFHTVGRGVVFNEMWHDYSISSMPVHGGKDKRVTNDYNLPMYEAVKTKWATLPIYCPEPAELGDKLRAMSQWTYSWKSSASQVDMTLNVPAITGSERADFTAGMGIRVENTTKFINFVSIDGRPYPAYSDHLVILPALSRGTHNIAVKLGDKPSTAPRLTYVSKTMTDAVATPSGVRFTIAAKTKARFSVAAAPGDILLNADSQGWDENTERNINGFVMSDRKVELVNSAIPGLRIVTTNRAITGSRQQAGSLALKIAHRDGTPEFAFRSDVPLTKATLGGQQVEIVHSGGGYELNLPAFATDSELVLSFGSKQENAASAR